MSFANLRISAKFPLVIVTVSLLTALATGITAHTQFSTQLEQFAEEQLVALRESRQAALESYLTSIRQDLDMLASSLLVEKAMVDFTSAWYEIGDEPGGQLQKLYIDDNPHPVGKKADLYNARDGSKYSIRHGFYHRWLRKFLEDRGYYDIFLFTPTGDLIYTVAKEADYATNFEAGGPWADSGLGEVFRAVNDNPTPGFQTFTDFEAYGPSNDAAGGLHRAAGVRRRRDLSRRPRHADADRPHQPGNAGFGRPGRNRRGLHGRRGQADAQRLQVRI